MKLRTKLTVCSILLIGLAVFICCALILSFVQSGAWSDITETGLTDFQAFEQSLWQTLTNDLPESKIVRHSLMVNAFRAIDGFVEFSLKENGEILSSNVGFDVESLLGDDAQTSVGARAVIEHKIIHTPDGDYFIAHATLPIGTERYDLSLARDITKSTNEIRVLAAKCALVGLVITTLAAAAMWLLVFRAMHPIERLRKGAGELARGHYDKRIDIRGHNELAELAGDFNTMADAIEENVDSLRDRSERQQAFINDLSHEMKTPITSILLNAETLLGRNVP
ncbi:MAG: HAMP domain-containing protein, partial [Clostridiaceae bacterium]